MRKKHAMRSQIPACITHVRTNTLSHWSPFAIHHIPHSVHYTVYTIIHHTPYTILGMLALGALCNGCLYALSPFLPPLFPLLLSSLSDPLPEMRSIACWVLSKFSALYPETSIHTNDDAQTPPSSQSLTPHTHTHTPSYYYLQSLYTLLPLLLDPHPKVQVAALSAMSILVEHSYGIMDMDGYGNGYGDGNGGDGDGYGDEYGNHNILTPHILSILSAFHIAFPLYGNKSKLLSVDMIGVIIDTLGGGVI
ncbi:hypothetical protein EON63_25070, partial [archaeon]